MNTLYVIGALVALVVITAFVPQAQVLVKKLAKAFALFVAVVIVTCFFGLIALLLKGLHWTSKLATAVASFLAKQFDSGSSHTWNYGKKVNGKLNNKLS